MSRTDGNFPTYNRLKIDPEVWPRRYWDRARTCFNCGKNWPSAHIFDPSPCCDAKTSVNDVPPDMRWPNAVSLLLNARFERWYDEWNEGTTDEELSHNAPKKESIEHLINMM